MLLRLISLRKSHHFLWEILISELLTLLKLFLCPFYELLFLYNNWEHVEVFQADICYAGSQYADI